MPMKKRCLFGSAVCVTLSILYACSDGDTLDSSNVLSLYGKGYDLEQGVIWHGEHNLVTSAGEYVFEDHYEVDGEPQTDKITGFTTEIKGTQTGNFMLCLYEPGFTIDDFFMNNGADKTLLGARGQGACISLHLSSPDTGSLKAGKYVFSINRDEFTFKGYSSSDYVVGEENFVPNELTGGEVNISLRNNTWTVVFKCTTSFGGSVEGSYQGMIKEYDIRSNESLVNSAESITLYAPLDTIQEFDMGSWEMVDFPDYTAPAFMRSSSMQALAAADFMYSDALSRRGIDIALAYDKENAAVYFESPIRMRARLWHWEEFNLSCHTKYMMAPESFTNEDFEEIAQREDFSFKATEERVSIPADAVLPLFVFVECGTGVPGVIRINEVTEAYPEYTMSATVTMDVKFLRIPEELKIR